MNLKLEKIKRKKLIDYSTLSDYMKNKNGKIIFIQGIRKLSKLNTIKKFSHDEAYERKIEFNNIIKKFNETFHIKPTKKIIRKDNKSATSRILLQNYFKNKTVKNFKNFQKIKKDSINVKRYINNNYIDRAKANSSYKISKKFNDIYNKGLYKDLYDEFQKIKNIIDNDKTKINNDKEIKLKNKLIKNRSDTQASISEYIYDDGKDKKTFIYKIKNINHNKSMIRLKKSKYLHKFSFYSQKNKINNSYIDDLKKNNIIPTSNKDTIAKAYILKLKEKKNNKFKTLEDECKIDFKIFKEYDFNPSRTFYELKENYKFIEDNKNDSLNPTNRYRYIMNLRNMLNKDPGIKLKRDFILSAKRVKKMKNHNFI